MKFFLSGAKKASKAADSLAAKQTVNRWMKWINEGPAKGLGKQHRMTRTAAGWVTSDWGPSLQNIADKYDAVEGLAAQDLAEVCQLIV